MARQDDDQIEHAAKRIGMDEEVTTAAIHRLSERVIKLEARNVVLLNALVRYRAHHDQCLPLGLRPCRCQICAQADEAAIKAAKGGA